MSPPPDEGPSPLDAFLEAFYEDVEADAVRPLAEYLARFLGAEDDIVRHYRAFASAGIRGVGGTDRASYSPDHVANYRLIREIGRGGQGTVYLAEGTHLHRRVALKIIDPGFASNEIAVERFEREAEITSRLDHPGICTVYETGEDRGSRWIAMRYVEGSTLAEKISTAREGSALSRSVHFDFEAEETPAAETKPAKPPGSKAPQSRAELMAICLFFERAARALHVVHEAGVIHRDIKPGNLMVTRSGEPVVLDFGLAQEAQDLSSERLAGTLEYMSPEQLVMDLVELDRRTDVWSLGVSIYESITLTRPFGGAKKSLLVQAIQTEDPPDPRRINSGISEDLWTVIQTALEKNRDTRYRTALEFAEDLRRVREYEPILAKPVTRLTRLKRWTQRNPALAASVFGLFLLLTVGIAVLLSLFMWLQSALTEKTLALVARKQALTSLQETLDGAQIDRDAADHARDDALAEGFALKAERELARDRAPESLAYAAASLCIRPNPLVGFVAAQARASAAPCLWISPQMAMGTTAHACFSPSGKSFMVSGSTGVSAIDAQSGIPGPPTSRENPLSPCRLGTPCCGSDANLMVEGLGESLILWELSDEPATNGDGKTSTSAGSVHLKDRMQLGSLVPSVFKPETERTPDSVPPRITAVDVSSRANTMVVGFSEGTLIVVKQDKVVEVLAKYEDPIMALSMSVSGERCASGTKDSIQILDVGARRMLYSLPHQFGPATSLAFEGDGSTERLLSGHANGAVVLWDLGRPERPHRVIARHEDGSAVSCVKFDDGDPRKVLSSGGRIARSWDLDTGTSISFVCDDAVTSVAASSAAKMIITTENGPRGVRRWKPAEGIDELRVIGHADAVTSMRTDGSRNGLVTASLDGSVRFWNSETGEQTGVTTIRSPRTSAPIRMVLSPDGRFGLFEKPPSPPQEGRSLDSAPASRDSRPAPESRTSATVVMFNSLTGENDGELALPGALTSSIVFSADGKKAAMGCDPGKLIVIDVTRPMTFAEVHNGPSAITSLAFLANGLKVVIAHKNGLNVIDVANGAEGPRRDVWGVPRILPRSAASEIAYTLEHDPSIYRWDVSMGEKEQPGPLSGHAGQVTGFVTGLSAQCGERLAASCSDDGTARVWDLKTRKTIRRIDSDTPIAAIVPVKDSWLATGHTDGTVRVWDIGSRHVHFGNPGDRMREVTAVAMSPDGDRIATAFTDGRITVWNCSNHSGSELPASHSSLTSPDAPTSKALPSAATALALDSDRTRVLAGYANGMLLLWDPSSRSPITLAENGPGHVLSVCFDADGKRALVMSTEAIEIWTLASRQKQVSAKIGGCGPPPQSITFSESGDHVLCTGDTGRGGTHWALSTDNLTQFRNEQRTDASEVLTMVSINRKTLLLRSCSVSEKTAIGPLSCSQRNPNVMVDFPPAGLLSPRAITGTRLLPTSTPPGTVVESRRLGSRPLPTRSMTMTLGDVIVYEWESKWRHAWEIQRRCLPNSTCDELCKILGDWERTLGLSADRKTGEVEKIAIPGSAYLNTDYHEFCRDTSRNAAPRTQSMPQPPPPPPNTR